MKKTLLFIIALAATNFMSAQLYINEIMVSPPGNDSPREFIEIRGAANTTIPAGTYIVQIEGDVESTSNSNGAGDIESNGNSSNGCFVNNDGVTPCPQGGIIDLSGQVLGSNGILVILTTGHPYTVDPAATVLLDVTDGELEDKSHTFLLIQTATTPSSNDDIDADENGIPDGTVYAGWTILDGISFADDDGTLPHDEFAYSDVIFADAAIVPTLKNPTTATVISTVTEFDYAGRIGNSTGSAVTNDETTSDWVGGDLASVADLTTQNWALSTSTGKAYPASFGGSELNHIGSPNPSQNTLLSTEEFISLENLSIYPNPVNNQLTIKAKNYDIESVEIFNLLGKRISHQNNLINNTMDVSEIATGVYLLKVTSGNNSVTKRIVIE